ncbi:putative spermidine/putrescine transport system ATP-binding protein [Microbacterium sp. 1154]|nr:putative spermidine/putrescine transport system ATP-binding protein [Microbacterium sp. 1154]
MTIAADPTSLAPAPSGASDPSPGLRLRSLRKTLGGRTIIDDLDLTVQSGELVSLLGPSGCGKTTTLRMIAGFLAPDEGAIEMAGRDVTRLGPDKRPSAMVFQNYALWPHMTVAKNVAYPLRLRRLSRTEIAERVEAVLHLVNLLHHRDSRPPRISGGEQQRVALARALVQEPEVLLLDEPLSNLDAKLRVKVREEIRDLQQRLGITTVVVTHDQEEALSISDRVAVMNAGRVEQFSAPGELYQRPATEFVATFIGSLNRVEGGFDGTRLVHGSDVVGIRPEDVVFTIDPRPGALLARVERVVPHGPFHRVRVRRDDATLDAFVPGTPPAVGAVGYASVASALVYRDGLLVDRVSR